MPRISSTFATPCLGDRDLVLGLLHLVVLVALQPRRDPRERQYHLAESATMPLMISGVRASSIRIESTSSTIAKL